jgi:Uma2 family endonuclease
MATLTAEIPAILRHEELEGRILYRKGTSEVLRGTKFVSEITGSSSLQAFIISILHAEISYLLSAEYLAFVSEPGLHIAHNSNVANDIAIFRLAQIERVNKKYFATPPDWVIEVDVKIDIDLTDYNNPEEYILHKSQTMLDFGVGTVVWITTEGARKVLIAQPGRDWRITGWESVVEFGPGCQFSLQALLERRGLQHLL